MTSRSLADWLALIETRHPQNIELGLERIRQVYAAMASPLPAARVVMVAGTNGKGSTVALVDALLRAAGLRTATYTSPHLLQFNERIHIHGRPIDDDSLCAALARVAQACGTVRLTYFEFTTLAALDLMARAALDVAVLEVGLGGRLDAVNLIDADVAVVTRIALDHQDWLGDSLDAIAVEKAGIFRAGRPALCGQTDPPPALRTAATACGAVWLARDEAFRGLTGVGGRWVWQGRSAGGEPLQLDDLPPLCLPQDSAATALQAVACLGLLPPVAIVRAVLAEARLSGRFQREWLDGVPVILDVAHNPDASAWLAGRLAAESVSGRTLAVYAALADKDIAGMLAPMLAQVDAWLLADMGDVGRACPAERIAGVLQAAGCPMISISRTVDQALARARSLAVAGDRIVVFGSFYTVGKVLAVLR